MEELKQVEFFVRQELYIEALKLLNTIICNMTYENDFLTPCLMARKREIEKIIIRTYEPNAFIARIAHSFKSDEGKLKYLLESGNESTSR